MSYQSRLDALNPSCIAPYIKNIDYLSREIAAEALCGDPAVIVIFEARQPFSLRS